MKIRDASPIEEETVTSPVRTLIWIAIGVAVGFYLNFNVALLIVAIVFFIFMHELGHYLTAKWAGMKVTEFFIGFGPRLWSFQRGETEYGIKAIPAGAYVRIIGMSNLEEVDLLDEQRTYRSKPYWRRLSVAVAGSTMHFLMAFVLVFAVFVVAGQRNVESKAWRVGTVQGPALDAGLKVDDRVVAVDGRRVSKFLDLSDYLHAHPGDTVELSVEREGEVIAIDATLARENPNGEKVGFLGISATAPVERDDPITGTIDSVKEMGAIAKESVLGLGHILSPSGVSRYVDTLSGPHGGTTASSPAADRPTSVIGIVNIGDQVAENGLVNILYLLFAFNMFIGVFNLIPLLPFDGGHVAIATYEKIRSALSGRRYEADVAKMLPLTYVVFVALALLFVTTIYLDIVDPVSIR